MVSGCPEQTVARRGSLVFYASKSSEAEREQLEPLERNERVCEGYIDTNAHPIGRQGLKGVFEYGVNRRILTNRFYP